MMFNDSPVKFRSTSSSFNGLNGLKQMNSTSSTFNKKNINSHLSIRTKSSYTSIKNTQGKLSTLKQQLNFLFQQVRAARQTTKETKLYLEFMRQDLSERKFTQMQESLKQQIQGLKKSINIGNRSDKLRYDSIKDNIHQINRNSRQIKSELQQLNCRMNRIENALGYYSGCQKHKY